MIYYITDSNHKVISNSDLKVLSFKKGIKEVKNFLNSNNEIYLDTETTGLDANYDKLSLIQIGDNNIQFVIDYINNIHIDFGFLKCLEDKLIIGQNLKFDIKFLRQVNINCRNIFDILLVEQRIRQGFSGNEKCGGFSKNRLVSNDDNPDSILFRYLGKNPEDLDKSVRTEAFGNLSNIVFNNSAIVYAANDIKYLKTVKDKQVEFIKRFNLEHIIYNVEFPLCSIVADIELEGFDLNSKRWLEIEDNHKNKMFEKEVELDSIVKAVYLDSAPKNNQKFLQGGKFNRERQDIRYSANEDLFGEVVFNKKDYDKHRKNRNKAYINWGSPKEIIELFGKLGLELPTKFDLKGTPLIDSKTGKLIKTEDFTTGAKSLELYLEENPNSESKVLIESLLEYRKFEAYVTKYGLGWLNKYLKPNGKVYTIFRQSTAVNGRFQSGGGTSDSDKYNAQNIPRLLDFRQCFHAGDDYSILTIDLSGAEVTIMADKAHDTWLYEMAVIKDDVHSPIIQECWRNIFKYRAGKKLGIWNTPKEYQRYKNDNKFLRYLEDTIDSKVEENYKKSKEFIVTKKINGEYRVSGKNQTFGSVYGCGAKKTGKTIGVSIEEGQVYLYSIEEMLPKTFAFVKQQAELACTRGYVIVDDYSKARVWFPTTIRAAREGRSLMFDEMIEISNQARNITISGTQANMIKEAMVNIVKYLIENNVYPKVMILSQVHDELVIRCPKELDGISTKFLENPVYFNYKEKKDTLPNIIKYIFEESSTKYLKHFQMKSEMEIKDTWTK